MSSSSTLIPLAAARESFLRHEPVPEGAVRRPILASWDRSRQLSVDPDSLDLSLESDHYRESPLLQVARPILDEFSDRLTTEPMSVILCDDEGIVLDRRTGDSQLHHHLDRVWLAPGFSYAERYVGTNGIGTTLESRGPAHVFGNEHFVEHLEDLACAGAPIRHPVTGRLVGILDLTCWRRHANGLMITTASMIASRIEERLLEHSAKRELVLLHQYLTACHHNRGAVLAVSQDLLMMNDRARELLDPVDQVPVIAAATEVLSSGRRDQLLVDLPSGSTVRLRCRPSWPEAGGGGVALVELTTHDIAPRRVGRSLTPQLPATVGSGPMWTKCVEAVDRHFGAREWLILTGEPGSGRRTLARATHQMHTPAAHLRIIDARDHGPAWLDEVAEELDAEGTLVLAHLDELPPDAASQLADLLEPHRESTDPQRPWVVATLGPDPVQPELSGVVACFPRTIDVPPLRHHMDDVPELVRHFVARLTHGGDLTCSPEALRVLMRNRWPGNVEQLQQVIRKVVARRRAGVVEVRDLPAETLATVRRVLTPLESIECDAIVNALMESGGNKVRAAQRLGMSRATIYRKVRDYGISLPA